MKLLPLAILSVALVVSCASKWVVPDPVLSKGGNTEKDTDSNADNQEKAAVGYLVADGNDENTYALIKACGFEQECPDSSGLHANEHFRHIRQSYDESLKKYVFDFYLHIKNDDDRGKANIKDRQRNEIKTGPHSPASLIAQPGETLHLTWLFRLPAGMQTTTKFAHVHQIKGIDNEQETADVGNPIITYTCRSVTGGQQFQVIYTSGTPEGSNSTYISKIGLAPFLGEWVRVNETIVCGEEGTFSTEIVRVSDNKRLLKLDRVSLNMWRNGTTGLRPKWGLYRNFGPNRSMEDQLRDEILQFADFKVEKL